MNSDADILAAAHEYFRSEVQPKAAEIDRSPDALRIALEGLGQQNLLALRRPKEYGGPGLSEMAFREFQEATAQYSGSLAFLQTQHQSAVSLIARSEAPGMKESYLPALGSGEKLVGIGFSQLRRPGPPIMTATPTENGYVLNGVVPWVTGWSFFPEFIIGAALPEGRAMFGIVPLTDGENIQISAPMKLVAMESALTVSVSFNEFQIPRDRVLFLREPDWIHRNDTINITLQGFFAVGCARAGLEILAEQATKKGDEVIEAARHALASELAECREAMIRSQHGNEGITTDEKLNYRAWAIDLAVRCAHAAIAAVGGSANGIDHPAGRIYREALVYTVSAQTRPIMQATLRRLVRQGL